MNRRALLNIALAGVVALLAVIAFIEPGKQAPKTPDKLSTLNKSEVHSIVIHRTGENDIALSKNDGGWIVDISLNKQHQQFRADTWKVDNILQLLQTEVSATINADGESFKKYGLENPRVSVRFNNALIEYGNINPLNQQRYLKIDNVVKLAKDSTYTQLLSVPTDFISRRLFDEDIGFSEIKLPELVLSKNDDGSWDSSPTKLESADAIQSLIDEWRFAQAISVQQLAAPPEAQEITLTDALGKQHRFKGFDKENGFYLTNQDTGIAYQFSLSNKQRLFQPEPPAGTP